jgi:hypothetical protein
VLLRSSPEGPRPLPRGLLDDALKFNPPFIVRVFWIEPDVSELMLDPFSTL